MPRKQHTSHRRLPIVPMKTVKGKRVLVRVDFNVPLQGKHIADDFRIVKTMPILHDLERHGARLILLGHLTEKKKHRSFAPMRSALSSILGRDVQVARSIEEAHALREKLPPHTYILLENLRVFAGEEKCDKVFARRLASLGDIYVNEAFSQSHRPYASIVLLPTHLPSYAGPLFRLETERLMKALNPPHPFGLILGGVKFATKVGVLKRFMKKADWIFVGGGLANTFLDAKGVTVGLSAIEKGEELRIRRTFLSSKKILLPVDVRVSLKKPAKQLQNIGSRDIIHDIGPETISLLESHIATSRMVLWNGPLGLLEKGYVQGTEDLISVLEHAKARTVLGGGDTMAIIHRTKREKHFYHVSTGGGAMLAFLADGTLPAITALEKSINMLS